jgi:SAM-dependent methyltransferase
VEDGQQPHWKFLVDNLPPSNQTCRVLDFGCATGDLTEYLLSLNSTLMVTAIDIDQELVDCAQAKLGKFQDSKVSTICGSGFDLDAWDYDLIYFNPPMIPNEPGFYGADGEWCMFQFFEWVRNSKASTALMLFDYCNNIKTKRGNQPLGNVIKSNQLDYNERGREARIVHDNSPVWLRQAEIKKVFPGLRFGSTNVRDENQRYRSVDRIAYAVEPLINEIRP